jgi:hypothetical protein
VRSTKFEPASQPAGITHDITVDATAPDLRGHFDSQVTDPMEAREWHVSR